MINAPTSLEEIGMFKIKKAALVLTAFCFLGVISFPSELARDFSNPPPSERPWVYWFWKNGNISKEGITADLEAMARVGIGGVILMEVALTVPPGPIKFFSPEWRKLFEHAVKEASRLGLVVTLNSAPGWTGTGGPWVAPAHSMKKLVAAALKVEGPERLTVQLPRPPAVMDFYEDVAVLAFPEPPEDVRIEDIEEKAFYMRGPFSSQPAVRPFFLLPATFENVPQTGLIPRASVIDLSKAVDSGGRLTWEVPPGKWTVMRFGFTSTGQTNRPSPLPGLECDKLDPKAVELHFKNYVGVLLEKLSSFAGKTLVGVHMDSWEVGAQNWTGSFMREFKKRRGYDPLPFLPVFTGRVIESVEISERFLWDLRKTVSELIVEHARRLRALAHRCGLVLSIEPYDMTPCEDMCLGAEADVPMCEFWSNTFDTRYSVKEATSVAHLYGKRITAAEAFTSGPADAWKLHPAAVKALGDWAFCEGVNRMVIHRYVHQPFLQVRPGLSLGPHGLHYERTQTWWDLSAPWHKYLARCQFLLRQGRWVADLLYLTPEGAPNVFQRPQPEPTGYKYDACSPEALKQLIKIRKGLLTTPSGAEYRMLILPSVDRMTPELLSKIEKLISAGATVVGSPPKKSPSLEDYPGSDTAVKKIAERLWGTGETPAVPTERRIGKGRIFWGGALRVSKEPQEKIGLKKLRASWIWYPEGKPARAAPPGRRHFVRRIRLPSDSAIESARFFLTADNFFTLFINGRKAGGGTDFRLLYVFEVHKLLRPGFNVLAVEAGNGGHEPNPAGLIGALVVRFKNRRRLIVPTDKRWRAVRGALDNFTFRFKGPAALELGPAGIAPWGTPRFAEKPPGLYPPSRAVTELLRRLGVPPDFEGQAGLRYAHRHASGIDFYFVSNGLDRKVESECVFRTEGTPPRLWHPESGRIRPLPCWRRTPDGRIAVPLVFEPNESYFVVFEKGGRSNQPRPHAAENFPRYKTLLELGGPWRVQFNPAWGGPKEPVVLENLIDWSKHRDKRICFYSGAAVYRTTFKAPPGFESESAGPLYLDLGAVHEFAQVKLNGRLLGTLWKRPFRVETAGALRRGINDLEITVVNLWPNRMIGDQSLPPDSSRTAGGTLRAWPRWLLEGKHSPTGRFTFASWCPYKASSRLLPSGLLGPVRIMHLVE